MQTLGLTRPRAPSLLEKVYIMNFFFRRLPLSHRENTQCSHCSVAWPVPTCSVHCRSGLKVEQSCSSSRQERLAVRIWAETPRSVPTIVTCYSLLIDPGVSKNEGNLQISKLQNILIRKSPIQRRDKMTSFKVRFSNQSGNEFFLLYPRRRVHECGGAKWPIVLACYNRS